MKKYFVTGIGTEIGKTIVSAIFTEALRADYWKPVQAGDLENTDSMKVKRLISNTESIIHPEAHLLTQPMSPHAAAEIDNVQLSWTSMNLPKTKGDLIIEGAGGLMVPINSTELMLDFASMHDFEVILVSRNYLGSINHTLMTYEVLKAKGCNIRGLVFNGESNAETEKYILEYTGLPCLVKIEEEEEINNETIRHYAEKIVW
jgi:dethiobiotin synthetase